MTKKIKLIQKKKELAAMQGVSQVMHSRASWLTISWPISNLTKLWVCHLILEAGQPL